jgi:adenylylsulfate kinase
MKISDQFVHQLSKQPFSIWLTGLSGSGKTTLANELQKILSTEDIWIAVLDGDELRKGLNNGLGFSKADRHENIRRAAEVSKLFLKIGISTINAFICPTEELRNLAESIVGKEHYIEIWVHAPLAICEQRDVKGLYKKARNSEIPDFTGVSAAFETPKNCHLMVDTSVQTPHESAIAIVQFIQEHIMG